MFWIFTVFSMKGKCLCERRTLYVYIQINVELDLKDGETLCKLKNNKTIFHPLLVHEVLPPVGHETGLVVSAQTGKRS